MAIKGSLREASLADICQLLALGGKTGGLSVTDRSNFGQVYFDRGRVTYARIVNRRDRLGDLLVRDGVVTRAQLDEVAAEQTRRPDARLGRLLLERGLITREQLERHVRWQIEEAVYYLFTWSQGTFYFEADLAPEDADILVAINAESLLLEGARRVDEWGLIQKRIPSLDLIFRADPARARAAAVELTPAQDRILPLLDGEHSVAEIVERTGLVEFEVGKALFGLIQAGFAEQTGRRARAAVARSREEEIEEQRNLGTAFYRTGMLEEARTRFSRVLELRSDDVDARHRLALIALREGRHREGARRLRELIEDAGALPGLLVGLAYALLRLGNPDEARRAAERAQVAGGGPGAALLRAEAHLAAGETDAAAEALEDHAARLDGVSPGPLYHHLRGLTAALRGRLAEARSVLAVGLKAHPGSAPLYVLAAVVAEREGELEEAERLNRSALELEPRLAQAVKNLGDLAYRLGLHGEAMEHYTRAAELRPDLGDDLYARLGDLHLVRSEREEAIRCWRRALELNPHNEAVRRSLEVAGTPA